MYSIYLHPGPFFYGLGRARITGGTARLYNTHGREKKKRISPGAGWLLIFFSSHPCLASRLGTAAKLRGAGMGDADGARTRKSISLCIATHWQTSAVSSAGDSEERRKRRKKFLCVRVIALCWVTDAYAAGEKGGQKSLVMPFFCWPARGK